MKIALDSNVISALWSAEPLASLVSERLGKMRHGNEFIVCGPVYVELVAHPKVSEQFVDAFLNGTHISVEFDTEEKVWREAARRFSIYANRRRRSGGKQAKRLLADFVIGAHALLNTRGLLTFDKDRYLRDFPELKLL